MTLASTGGRAVAILDKVPVEIVEHRGGAPKNGLLVCFPGEREKLMANGNKTPRVLSVDKLLVVVATILLAILSAILSVVWQKVDDHDERIAKAEAWIQEHRLLHQQSFEQLQRISAAVSLIQAANARTEAQIESLMDLVKKLER